METSDLPASVGVVTVTVVAIISRKHEVSSTSDVYLKALQYSITSITSYCSSNNNQQDRKEVFSKFHDLCMSSLYTLV